MSKLWYKKEATCWDEALPLGNGRMGAMVFGDPVNERIQLNEESIWYGGPVDRNNPDAAKKLPMIRELILSGKISEAERLMKYSLSGCPESQHPYQSLGDIHMHFYGIDDVRGYERSLDLETAVYEQIFGDTDTSYTRQIYISNPDDVMVIHLKASGKKKIDLDAILRRERFFDGVKKVKENAITLYGNLGKGGSDFAMCLSAAAKGGSVEVIGEHLVIKGAEEAVLYFCADSTYHVKDVDIEGLIQNILSRLESVEGQKLSEIKERHIKDYKLLFNRVDLEIDEKASFDTLPTDERIKSFDKNKNKDIGLCETFFDFGRYLLISCSRKGTLPANLQGIWNEHMSPPWDSKYTININAQMNYWPAESTNLSECHEPLFELIKKMVPNGQKTAKTMYGCNGWTAHHNTDIWGDTAPQDIWLPSTYWVMGAAWLCLHIWEHYEYTLDKDFLKENFEILRGSAEFFLDYLIEKDGFLVTCPSVSPENTFILPDGTKGNNIYGVTMDNQILRDLFNACIKAAEVLDAQDELNSKIIMAKDKLMPTKIASDGSIMEWPEEFGEDEPGHRHISHLFGLFPSDQINPDDTPELCEAAKKTLDKRLQNGGGHTGWSRAWIINFYAKLRDAEKAYENLSALISGSTYPNMFDRHPPFQIDGNFGGTAAISNMLLQSGPEKIVILPALPKAWKNGHVRGLRVKGDGTVNIEWKNGKLAKCEVYYDNDRTVTVRYKDKTKEMTFEGGKVTEIKSGILGLKTV